MLGHKGDSTFLHNNAMHSLLLLYSLLLDKCVDYKTHMAFATLPECILSMLHKFSLKTHRMLLYFQKLSLSSCFTVKALWQSKRPFVISMYRTQQNWVLIPG